jgi:hypothetical protein
MHLLLGIVFGEDSGECQSVVVGIECQLGVTWSCGENWGKFRSLMIGDLRVQRKGIILDIYEDNAP